MGQAAADTRTVAEGLPAALEFYKAARTELVERVKLRDQVLLAYLAFVGVVSGAAVALSGNKEVALVLPFLGMGCAILVSQHNSVIGALIRYTSVDLHSVLVPKTIWIPEFVNSNSFREHSQRSNFLRSAGHAIVIIIPEIVGLGINYQHALFSPFPLGPAWWFGTICIFVSIGVIWSAHAGRASVYKGTPWQVK